MQNTVGLQRWIDGTTVLDSWINSHCRPAQLISQFGRYCVKSKFNEHSHKMHSGPAEGNLTQRYCHLIGCYRVTQTDRWSMSTLNTLPERKCLAHKTNLNSLFSSDKEIKDLAKRFLEYSFIMVTVFLAIHVIIALSPSVELLARQRKNV